MVLFPTGNARSKMIIRITKFHWPDPAQACMYEQWQGTFMELQLLRRNNIPPYLAIMEIRKKTDMDNSWVIYNITTAIFIATHLQNI